MIVFQGDFSYVFSWETSLVVMSSGILDSHLNRFRGDHFFAFDIQAPIFLRDIVALIKPIRESSPMICSNEPVIREAV